MSIKESLLDALQEVRNTAKVPGILKRNLDEMKEAGRLMRENDIPPDELDNYWHRKAQYEAAQLGTLPAQVALQLGRIKEIWDVPKNFLNGWAIKDIVSDMKKDLKNNKEGSNMGLRSSLPAKDNDELNQYRTPAMLQLLRVLKGSY